MGIKRTQQQKTDSCSGVSESISAILLVSIVVIAVGSIALLVFSQPVPTKIPALNFMTGVSSSKTTLYLYHNGGDTLNAGEFSVLVDGVPASYTISGGGSQWSLGKNLVVPISKVPDKVTVVCGDSQTGGVSGNTGRFMLDEASANIVKSANVSPDQLPYLDCSAVKNWDCADQIPLDIVLSRIVASSKVQRMNLVVNDVNNGITGSLSSPMLYHYNITVSGRNSSIVFGSGLNNCENPRIVPLGPNDVVSVNFPTNSGPEYFIMYGIAPSLMEMSGGSGGDITVRAYNATTKLTTTNGGNAICHTWITEYSSIDSTMRVKGEAVAGAPFANFIVNETTVINGPESRIVIMNNVKPTQNGMYLVSFPGNSLAPLYVIGWADSVTIGGVPLPANTGV